MREVRQGSLLQGAVVPLRALCALCAGMWSGRAAIRRRAQQRRARPVLEARGRSRSPRARARAHTQGLRSSATAAAPRATRRWCWCRHQRAQAGRVAGMEGGWPARRSRRSGRRASGGVPPNGARSAAGASRAYSCVAYAGERVAGEGGRVRSRCRGALVGRSGDVLGRRRGVLGCSSTGRRAHFAVGRVVCVAVRTYLERAARARAMHSIRAGRQAARRVSAPQCRRQEADPRGGPSVRGLG